MSRQGSIDGAKRFQRLNRSRLEVVHAAAFGILVATVGLALFYPGIMLNDSHARWLDARRLAGALPTPSNAFNDWFQPLPSWLMALSYRVTGEYGFFTWMQAFLAAFVFRLCLAALLPGRALLSTVLAVLVCSIPLVNSQLWTPTSDALVTIGLLLVTLGYLQKRRHEWSWGASAGAIIAGVLLAVLSRANSPTVVPMALFALFPGRSELNWKRLCWVVGIPAVVIGAERWGRAQLEVTHREKLGYTLLWETLGMARMHPAAVEVITYPFEDVVPWATAMEAYSETDPTYLAWSSLRIPQVTMTERAGAVYRAFLGTVLGHPQSWLRMKAHAYSMMFPVENFPKRGFALHTHYDHHWYNPDFNISYDSWLPGWDHAYKRLTLGSIGFFVWMRPDRLFLFCGLILGFRRVLMKNFGAGGFLFLLALTYYGGFVVFPSGFFFRYFFPALILLFLALIDCGSDLAIALRDRIPHRGLNRKKSSLRLERSQT